jgi:hypothetical protein
MLVCVGVADDAAHRSTDSARASSMRTEYCLASKGYMSTFTHGSLHARELIAQDCSVLMHLRVAANLLLFNALTFEDY